MKKIFDNMLFGFYKEYIIEIYSLKVFLINRKIIHNKSHIENIMN